MHHRVPLVMHLACMLLNTHVKSRILRNFTARNTFVYYKADTTWLLRESG